jgi:hypothetical protein
MKKQWPLFTGLIVALIVIFCIAAANLNRVVEWTPYAGEIEDYTWVAPQILMDVEADSLVEEARFMLDGENIRQDYIIATKSELVLEMELTASESGSGGLLRACELFLDRARKRESIQVKKYSCTLVYRGDSFPLPSDVVANKLSLSRKDKRFLELQIDSWMESPE